MKRFFAIAAIAALTLTSCNQAQEIEEVNGFGPEMTFSIANIATKGYVEGATFDDTAFDKLHEASTNPTTPRTMNLSAYLYPQSGASSNYFIGETFAVQGTGDTRRWHHTPAIYWPMGGKLAFLAYSVTEQFDGTAVKWNSENAASQVVLNVSDVYLQDDILYAGVYQRSSGADHTATPATAASDVEMTFKHAQAWIEFQLKSETADIVKVNEIIVKNVNTRGQLTINAPTSAAAEASATAVWDFNYVTKRDLVVPDTYSVYNDPEGTTPKYIGTDVEYLDFLLPGAQDGTEFLIHYQLKGQDNVLEYSYKLTGSKWNMGLKYIYEIEFRPYEIVVKPSVQAWDNPAADQLPGFPSVLE